ncbi:ankyrin repeat-containing domain protein [Xylariomycetidae sp. FL2044]|nr:ankyrin repeat-containing domain protein [Xylariomycetidae sp. FL2044]
MATAPGLKVRSSLEPRDLSIFSRHENILRELYIDQNKPLIVVKQLMENEYQFPKFTESTFEVALRERLGLRKNLTDSDWILIGHDLENRKRQGKKKSQVLFNNTVLDLKKVNKAIRRYKGKQANVIRNRKHRPIQRDILIRTPPPLTSRLPYSAPDFHFPNSRELVPVDSPSPIIPVASSTPSGVLYPPHTRRLSSYGVASTFEGMQISTPFMQFTSSLDQLVQQFHLPGHASTSSESIIPYLLQPKQGTATCGSGSDAAFTQALGGQSELPNPPHSTHTRSQVQPQPMMISPYLDGFKLFHQFFYFASNSLDSDFEHTRELLDWIGSYADLRMLCAFFSIKSPTLSVLWKKLLDYIHWMKHAGAFSVLVEIGIKVSRGAWIRRAPGKLLGTAAWIGSGKALNTAKRLLEHGASPDSPSSESRVPGPPNWMWVNDVKPLHMAAMQCDIDMMTLFLDYGADSAAETLTHFGLYHNALEIVLLVPEPEQLKCAEFLLEKGLSVDHRGRKLPERAVKFRCSRCASRCTLKEGPWAEDIPPCVTHRSQVGVTEGLGWCPIDGPMFVMDILYYSDKKSDHPLYKLVAPYNDRIQNSVTAPGISIAACEGIETLKYYLDLRANTHETERRVLLEIALSEAVRRADLEVVNCLINFGVDPNTLFLSQFNHDCCPHCHHMINWGAVWNPVIRASINRDLEMLEILVSAGADINLFNSLEAALRPRRRGRYSLVSHRAAKRVDIARCLLNHGFDLPKFGNEALQAALLLGTPNDPEFYPDAELWDVLSVLSSSGPIFDSNRAGMGLLQFAIRSGCNLQTVHSLMKLGERIHSEPSSADGNTMLHDALLSRSQDRLSIVELLLHHGADCRVGGGTLTTLEAALWTARHPKHKFHKDSLALFRKLHQLGAPLVGPSHRVPKAWVQKTWEPVLPMLIAHFEDRSLVLEILDAGADINQIGECHNALTPLQAACDSGDHELARELIRRGADINAPAYELQGRTALQAFVVYYWDYPDEVIDLEFAQFMIDQGADVNGAPARTNGMTALQYAAAMGSVSLTYFFLQNGAHINAASGHLDPGLGLREGIGTALDIAALYGRLDTVSLLLDAGARSAVPGITGFDGAIHAAEKEGELAVVHLLRNYANRRAAAQGQAPIAAQALEDEVQRPDFGHIS